MAKIYCVKHLDRIVYVGYTTQSIERRWTMHRCHAKKGYKYILYNAMRKYGIQDFSIELIADYALPDDYVASVCEPFWIRTLGTHKSCGGYNMTYGGDLPPSNKGRKHSPETRARVAAARRGKSHSPETRAKISATMKRHKLANTNIEKEI
jgi:group I intron endonuclease